MREHAEAALIPIPTTFSGINELHIGLRLAKCQTELLLANKTMHFVAPMSFPILPVNTWTAKMLT